jgi:geranylgeranylglycerol-phosphate geranylgeranyltransferase
MNSDTAGSLGGLISLARPLNVLLGILGVLSCGLIAHAGAEQWASVFAAAAAAGLLTAAANTINDVFDVETDRINKPHRAVTSGAVSASRARAAAAVLGVAGLALSTLAGLLPFAIALPSAAMMYVYSSHLKRVPVAGNVAVGLITGLAFPFGCAAAGNIAAGVIPGIFALLYSVGRELVKDAEDVEGDMAAGISTFATREGAAAAAHLAGVFFFVLILLSPLPWLFGVYSDMYLWTIFVGVDAVLLGIMIYLWERSNRERLIFAGIVLKYDMVLGIAAVVLGS